MLPILDDNVPLTSKVVPSNDKLEASVPPNLNVPSFKLNSEPPDTVKLFDVILPVEIVSPDIFVLPVPAGFKYNALISFSAKTLS